MKYKRDNVSITVKLYTYIFFKSEENPGRDREVLTTCVLWFELTLQLFWVFMSNKKRPQISITLN